ncbi:MAG: hypothetical protein HY764_03120 [Candidatus Portnoybacteria bacterium]|nr:hypothetical protein [Candidatus Portnoybacteria bacterium]
MAKWWYRLARKLYGVPDSEILKCDVVVPLGYGLNRRHELPAASIDTLLQAMIIANNLNATIVWASANYFWPGCDKEEDKEKDYFLQEWKFTGKRIMTGGVTNSVTEAEAIRRAINKADIQSQYIALVCDWPQTRSARLIYRKVFPESEILIWNVNTDWDEECNEMVIFLTRSNARWLFANILRHLMLRLMPFKWVAKIKQPLKMN